MNVRELIQRLAEVDDLDATVEVLGEDSIIYTELEEVEDDSRDRCERAVRLKSSR